MAARTVADTGIRADLVRWAEARPIDRAYREIDATFGGYIDRTDPVAVARDELLGEVLAILERHGAVDPTLAPAARTIAEAA